MKIKERVPDSAAILRIEGLERCRLPGRHHVLLHAGPRRSHDLVAGDADLGHVASQISEVHIAGSGNTDIAPTDEADIHIAGSGDVNLHSNPKKLETHIAGSGRIHNISPGG